MGSKLQIERAEEEGRPVLRLKGTIDEDADLRGVFSKFKGQTILDLGAIEMINSAGVRQWMNAVSQLPSDAQIILERCSPRIVEQLNYVADFIGKGRVASFYAPYYCPKCKTESRVLLRTAEARKNLRKPQKCAVCKGALEFDDVAEEYFVFLR